MAKRGKADRKPSKDRLQTAFSDLDRLVNTTDRKALAMPERDDASLDPRMWSGPEGDYMRSIHGDPPKGLTAGEKQELYTTGERVLHSASEKDFNDWEKKGRKAEKQQRKSSAKADELWREFQTQYPDEAQDPDRVAEAADRVMADMQREGENVERVIQDDPGLFINRVGLEAGGSEPRTRTRSAPATQPPDDSGRTQLAPSKGSGGKGKKAKESDSAGSLVDDLKATQRRSGYW